MARFRRHELAVESRKLPKASTVSFDIEPDGNANGNVSADASAMMMTGYASATQPTRSGGAEARQPPEPPPRLDMSDYREASRKVRTRHDLTGFSQNVSNLPHWMPRFTIHTILI